MMSNDKYNPSPGGRQFGVKNHSLNFGPNGHKRIASIDCWASPARDEDLSMPSFNDTSGLAGNKSGLHSRFNASIDKGYGNKRGLLVNTNKKMSK